MRAVFSPKAEDDLMTAAGFIAERNLVAALEFLTRVRTLVQRLADEQFEGIEEQLRSDERVRSWPVPPYRVYYRRTADVLEVVRIYHQARRPITK